MADYLCGLDLGQAGDYTALSVIRRSMLLAENGHPRRNLVGRLLHKFECVHLERFQLGTPYPAMVASISELLRRPALAGPTKLVIDATGVGRAVVDLFLNERLPAKVCPLTITAGDTSRRDAWNMSRVTGYWVPKNELVSSVRANLESGRLKVARLKLGDTLKKELIEFRVKLTKAANETFSAREGTHDDLVLAVAMPVWLGEQREVEYSIPGYSEFGPNHPESLAVNSEEAAEFAAKILEDEAEQQAEERRHRDINAAHWWN